MVKSLKYLEPIILQIDAADFQNFDTVHCLEMVWLDWTDFVENKSLLFLKFFMFSTDKSSLISGKHLFFVLLKTTLIVSDELVLVFYDRIGIIVSYLSKWKLQSAKFFFLIER